ncbi:tetratricopeptide repeat protein [candidate division WOR-3 bacterium]|nr:tetratricopeptide repeat protein [candidate division WOR-3 bacterium]
MRKLTVIILIFVLGASTGCLARSSKKDDKKQDQAVADSLADLEAQKFLSVGLDFYKKEQYEEAIEFYNKALAEYPNHYKTMVAMAVTYQKLNDVGSTEKWYRSLFTVYPDSLEGYLGLGGVFIKMASYDQSYLDSALNMYQKGLELFPSESDFYHGIAEVLLRQGKPAEADSVFQKGIETNPDNLGIRHAYVEYLVEQKRYSDALQHQLYIVNVQQDDPFAFTQLGDIYMELKNFTEATEAYNKAVELRPDDISIRLKLAFALMQQKKNSDADAVLAETIGMDTTRLVPRLYRGINYLNWGKETSAEKEFKYVISKDEVQGDALYYLGVIYVRRATNAANQKTKEEWQKGCADARTATGYLERSRNADPRNASRVNQQLEHLKEVRDALKEKLFLIGITDC